LSNKIPKKLIRCSVEESNPNEKERASQRKLWNPDSKSTVSFHLQGEIPNIGAPHFRRKNQNYAKFDNQIFAIILCLYQQIG